MARSRNALTDVFARFYRRPAARRRPARENRKTINLALQGGGAHGAFTWGVLDGLLDDGRLAFDGISGTSAGALNAVVLADGLGSGGADRAIEGLAALWHGISHTGSGVNEVFARLVDFWRPAGLEPYAFVSQMSNLVSPYGFNPLNINPLRALLAGLVDFDRLRRGGGPAVFVSATNVRTGKIRVFSGTAVSADAVMASAALPYLFQAVEIDGEAYWDGGFMGNPALFPLFDQTKCEDILLVQVNPVRREEVPKTPHQIMERVNEITFNASLLRELRAIDFVNRLIEENRLDRSRYRPNRLHRIDASQALAEHTASTKLNTSWDFFRSLHEAGRAAAEEWLDAHFDDVGVRATLDLKREYG